MQKKSAAGILLSLACVPAMADTGFYTGVGVVQGTLKDNIAGLAVKATDTGFKVFGGYRFNEYGSLEVAYFDGGAPHDTVSGIRVESDGRAIQGSAILHIPMTVRFEGFVRAGFLIWDTENSARVGQLLYTEDNDGTDFSLGIGAAWHVTSRFGLRAEYEGAELDGTDLRAYSLGGLFRF